MADDWLEGGLNYMDLLTEEEEEEEKAVGDEDLEPEG